MTDNQQETTEAVKKEDVKKEEQKPEGSCGTQNPGGCSSEKSDSAA